jgi:hypothetical protein
MPQARADSEDAIEKAILGQASASDALKGAEQAIAPQISSYNNSTG